MLSRIPPSLSIVARMLSAVEGSWNRRDVDTEEPFDIGQLLVARSTLGPPPASVVCDTCSVCELFSCMATTNEGYLKWNSAQLGQTKKFTTALVYFVAPPYLVHCKLPTRRL